MKSVTLKKVLKEKPVIVVALPPDSDDDNQNWIQKTKEIPLATIQKRLAQLKKNT